MTKNKKIGVSLIAAPLILLFLVLTTYAVATRMAIASIPIPNDPNSLELAPASELAPANQIMVRMQIVRVVAGLVGMIAIIATVPCLGAGIYFLTKKETEPTNTTISS